MTSTFRRLVYVRHDPQARTDLAEALGRKLLEEQANDSPLAGLLKLRSFSALERWARAHGPDSLEVRPSIKASIPLILESGAEFGFHWDLGRNMTNKSFEEMSILAASLLGKPESCSELLALVRLQQKNPARLSSDRIIFTGDLRLVRAFLDTSGPCPHLTESNASIDLDFANDPWLGENGSLVHKRECEVLAKITGLNPLKLACFAIWI